MDCPLDLQMTLTDYNERCPVSFTTVRWCSFMDTRSGNDKERAKLRIQIRMNGPMSGDYDDCLKGPQKCHASAECSNVNGSYSCQCKEGYTGDGYTCQPHCRGDCRNGGKCIAPNVCECRHGYLGANCELAKDGGSKAVSLTVSEVEEAVASIPPGWRTTGWTKRRTKGWTKGWITGWTKGGPQGGLKGGPQGGLKGGPQGGPQGGLKGGPQGGLKGGSLGGLKDGPHGVLKGGLQGGLKGGSGLMVDHMGGLNGGPQGGLKGEPQGRLKGRPQGGPNGGPQDINECEIGIAKCRHNRSACVNIPGWYHCDCLEGFHSTWPNNDFGQLCLDVNECKGEGEGHTCHPSMSCVNTEGGYKCACPENVECRQSCLHEGKEHMDQSKWISFTAPCKECLCQVGRTICRDIPCDCASPSVNLRCCPSCDSSGTCSHQESQVRQKSGDTWFYQCQRCNCLNGETKCGPIDCPQLSCQNAIQQPGDCCPVCSHSNPCASWAVEAGGQDLSQLACVYSGINYSHGDEWTLPSDPCTQCQCKAGHICCSAIQKCTESQPSH
ncbi:Protein kinase C-binding protein nell1 [Bulinus truncatus]|nr:Protein kinase C-binding protein nell1 [Bulinus truncatus]